ncbi:hypothetical protein VaNZ11_008954 [Volvox africanus]|uniref:Nuclear pore complex protein Nup85 n=1 Tax=Volvox africanus TaxID=51714 RepID=A0ABQ5S7J6_9CHLO|nr:hypothetical protein VaNZ11_008954 [Volvox africanus]
MSGIENSFRVRVAPGSRLHFSWGLGSELRLLEIQNPHTDQGDLSGEATRVFWDKATDTNLTVSLKTAEQYKEMQRSRLQGAQDDAQLARVASYARTIREILMKRRLSIDIDGGHSQLEAALWHLLEIFFVDAPRREGNLGEDFVHWLAAHADITDAATGEFSSEYIQDLLQDPAPDRKSEYWPMIRRLVALGRTSTALELLKRHAVMQEMEAVEAGLVPMRPALKAQLDVINFLDVVIRRQPRMAPSANRDTTARAFSSVPDFTAARAHWLTIVQEYVSEGAYEAARAASERTVEGARSVLAVLLGQPAALRASTNNWLELAAAEIVHRQGGCVEAANQLGAVLTECQAACRRDDEESALLAMLAELLEALTDMDISGVVSVMNSFGLVQSWLMLHSLELMAAYPGSAVGGGSAGRSTGILTERLAVSGCDQMEYFRLIWAESLLPGCLGGGWQLALQYLAWCPQHGAAAAEALLEALPVNSCDVRTLEKSLVACRRLGLGSTAAVLCRIAGADALSRGFLGSGVQWMVRAADPRRTAAVLEMLEDMVADTLAARLDKYQAGPLNLPGGGELEALLDWLPGFGEAGAEEAPAVVPSGGRDLGAFLVDVLKLSRAMGKLAAARDANAPPDDPAVLKSLSAGHTALMSMVASRTPPRRLSVLLLFYALPLLEATAAGGRLFSLPDVQQLLDWMSECECRVGAVSGGEGLVLSYPDAPPCARAVQLALVRAMARAHTLQNESAGGGNVGGVGGAMIQAAAGG